MKSLASTPQMVGVLFVVMGLGMAGPLPGSESASEEKRPERIQLPEPRRYGKLSLEAALDRRRSIREFRAEPISLAQVSQLLWAAQGTTTAEGRRTAPSAGATYPLEVYLVAGQVTALSPGLYRYRPGMHDLVRVAQGDLRATLAEAALAQEPIQHAPVTLVLTAVTTRTARRYGARAERYVHLEAGHAAQNVLLQAVTLNLGAVPIGAFTDAEVKRILALAQDEQPLYLIPVGEPTR